jgi:hypothetical protein
MSGNRSRWLWRRSVLYENCFTLLAKAGCAVLNQRGIPEETWIAQLKIPFRGTFANVTYRFSAVAATPAPAFCCFRLRPREPFPFAFRA